MKIGAKVKEKIARTIGAQFSTAEIVNVFTDANVATDPSLYAKWRITLDAFNKMKTDETFFRVLEEFCHPLNFIDLASRQNFIDQLNSILSFEEMFIQSNERSAEVLPMFLKAKPASPQVKKDHAIIPLPDINKSTFSEKVIDLVVGELEKSLSNWNIRKIITPIIKKNDPIYSQRDVKEYIDDILDENPFYTFNDVLQTIRKKDEGADKTICLIITALLHPLNYNADEDKSEDIAEKISKYLKYDKFYIQRMGNDFEVLSETEMDEIHGFSPADQEQTEKEKLADLATIKQNKELIKSLRETHQVYMDVIDTFCQDSKNPTKQLNDAYLFLVKKIEAGLQSLGLKQNKVFFYKPFKNDLYTAEIEWNGSGASTTRRTPRLSWDAIRPSLYKVHSDITNLNNIAEEDVDMTDDEKKLEEITNLISEKRTAKIPVPEPEKTIKMEITKMPDLNVNTIEKNTVVGTFYIIKKGDDFYYKGRYINLSKKAQYYKVFSALYAQLPEGGEISYADLSVEVKSRIPATKSNSIEAMNKLIQSSLTDKQNGFVRYAGIPDTEDNGKPLIDIARGSGVIFNNKPK